MKWYYAGSDGERVGPLTEAEFQAAVESGQVVAETLVWTQGMADWLPFSETGAAQPKPTPGAAAGSSPAREQDWDAIAQRVKEGVNPEADLAWEFGGFWIRFCAYFVDSLILQVITFGIQFALGMGLALVQEDSAAAIMLMIFLFGLPLLITIAYYTYFHGNPNHQATPGKKLMKLRVITAEGEDVTYMRAFARYWAAVLSALILCIGYIMAAFDEEKRTLHDHICNTRVIKR